MRNQDFWLFLAGLGILFLLVSLPVLFGVGRDFGRDLAAGEAVPALASTLVVISWLGFLAFGILSGVGSDGEVDNQAGILSIRPPKDVAGGLLLAMVLGYAPFAALPALALGVGIAVGIGSPAPLAGILLAATVILVSAVTVGFATGLFLKGLIRRSPWLTRLKPLLGAMVVLGYFWLSTTGRLGTILTDIGALLDESPLGWLADLAFLTTAGTDASVLPASGALVLFTLLVPIGVLVVIRGAEFAWYVDELHASNDSESSSTEGSTDDDSSSYSVAERVDRALATVGVHSATRGVTTTVLLRGYRSPLQLIYVVAPLLFALPAIETTVRTGIVPEWFPWMILLYGAWAAGVSFPLNILGDQGATLPALLTSGAHGKRVVHGYILATVLVFAPMTAIAGSATAHGAGRSFSTLVAVGLAGPLVVIAGAVLAAGIGCLFPRFQSINLTSSTKAVLPSKTAFGLFSVAGSLAVTAVSILADDLYALLMSDLLSTYLPYGMTVDQSPLETMAVIVVGVLGVAVVTSYLASVRRLESYTLD